MRTSPLGPCEYCGASANTFDKDVASCIACYLARHAADAPLCLDSSHASLESRLSAALASTRTAVEALRRMTAERDEWKHEAQSNASKLEGEMNLRHRLTEQAHEIERLREQVKVEHEGFTGRRKEKSAQWDALVAERDRETERANKAFRERDEARAQVAQLREVLAYAKVNVKPTAIWCFAAIDAALARTPSPDRGGGK